MADDLEGLKNLGKELGLNAEKLKLFEKGVIGLFSKMKDGSGEAIEAAKRVSAIFGDSTNVLEKLRKKYEDIIKSSEEMGESTKSNIVTFAAFAGTALGLLKIPPGLADITSGLEKMSGGFTNSIASASNLIKILPLIGTGASEFISKLSVMSAPVDSIRQLEASFLRTAAEGGNLTAALEGVGSSFEDIDAKAAQYASQAAAIGTANNFTTAQTLGFINAIGKIPESLDQTVVGMKLVDSALKVEAGTFRATGSVIGLMSEYYNILGIDGEKTLQVIARTSAIAQQLKIPVQSMDTYVKDAASTFKLFGDNTQGAIDIMARFGPGLKESGLGPSAINQIVTNVTGSIGKLDIAQKAFLSAQSGGKGGLAGGYAIDLMMRKGKVADVYAQVEQTLRKMFGGKVFTLEEASKDQGAAAQFTKQIQMLTSGPLKIAGNDQEAEQILEVFAKGGKIGDKAPAPGAKAVENAAEVGSKLQDRQANVLLGPLNAIEASSLHAAASMSDIVSILSKDPGRRMRAGASKRIGNVTASSRTSMEKEDVAEFNSMKDYLKEIPSNLEEMGASLNEKLKNTGLIPKEDETSEHVGTRPAQKNKVETPAEMTARILEKRGNETGQKIVAQTTGTNTLIIKVMGKDEVLQVIKVEIDKLTGQMSSAKATNNVLGFSE